MPGPSSAQGQGSSWPEVDPDLSAAVSYSLAQTVEARLRGIRNYTRLLRERQCEPGRSDE